MPKLNQVIAIEKGIKAKSNAELNEAYHAIQKPALFAGIARAYRPKDDDGEQLPPEQTRVQARAEVILRQAAQITTALFDITATKDASNCTAKADVVVDGKTLLTGMPVTTLLFLEKQLIDLATVVKKMPTLDPSESWKLDQAQDAWATEPVETTRTKKVMRNHVKAAATDKHPAQVETFTEDVIVGFWKTVKYSGALPQARVTELLERIAKLQAAVKMAREEANSAPAVEKKIGAPIFEYLLA